MTLSKGQKNRERKRGGREKFDERHIEKSF